ncbi:MAG: universal stress protein [Nitrospiria bacterium]|jgi:nucleotide-binding universal stress UspA family protein
MVCFSKILFPTDFSEDWEHQFDFVVYFARLQKGKLYILHVITKDYSHACMIPSLEVGPVPEMGVQVPVKGEFGEDEIKQKMFEVVQLSRKEGVIVEDLLAHGKPHAEILRISKEREIDLIVMGNHEKSDFERRILGGTIERVVHKASCPVFIVNRSSYVPERFQDT